MKDMYSPLKMDTSMKGLSEIIEQSYKDQLETSKYQLAKLANQEFLSQYLQLNNNRNIISDYRYLLDTPACEVYRRFQFAELQKQEAFRKEIRASMQGGVKKSMAVYSKEELKALAVKKLEESAEKEKLEGSRKERKENFYEQLRVSRKKDEIKEYKGEDSPIKGMMMNNRQSPTKDAVTEQSPEDLFMRLEVIGQARDRIKKKWYSWGEKGKKEERQAIIQEWNSNHALMKALLESLLEQLNRSIGTFEVFNHLKISSQNILKSLSLKSSRIDHQKSLGSTRLDRNLHQDQVKLIYRFGSWFNKLLLDQRQLEYIHPAQQ